MKKCSDGVNKILGENIRIIRKNNGLTQEQLAEKLDLNPHHLSQIEIGNSGISIDTAIKICQITNSPASLLFKDIITPSRQIENYDLLTDNEKELVNEIIILLIKQQNNRK